MSNYSIHLATQSTPQSAPLFGRETEQAQNSAGGYVFTISPMQQLLRFLILGAEGGTYYATEKQLTLNNAQNILGLLGTEGVAAVNLVVEISTSQPARAPKNDACVFVLALAATKGSETVKNAAFDALNSVCRIPTDLFAFVEHCKNLGGGWGRRMKRAISEWYTVKTPEELARLVTKYQSRNGWSHRDVLRLSHAKAVDENQNGVLHFAARNELIAGSSRDYLEAVQMSLSGKLTKDETIGLIRTFDLPREVIATGMLNEKDVWAALLEKMPIRAMIRNLPKMTRVGLLGPMSSANQIVLGKLNETALVRGRVHPVSVLIALKTYEAGKSLRGEGIWTPVPQIVDGLEEAFYKAFGSLEATNKRTMIALDVSGSMGPGEFRGPNRSMYGGDIGGVPGLSARMGSAAMAMVVARTEPNYAVTAFSHTLIPVDFIRKNTSIADVMKKTAAIPMGGTDCALPMLDALKRKIPVDVFQVFTDSETWAGSTHPSVALQRYRKEMGINAKLVVNGMTATNFTIADPKDPGMLDVAGFDSATPNIIAEWVKW